MNNFIQALYKKISESENNNFGIENYDEYRFGKYAPLNKGNEGVIYQLKKVIKKIIRHRGSFIAAEQFIDSYETGLQRIWENLSTHDKNLFVELIAYRVFGYEKIKLSRNNNAYWDAIKKAEELADQNDSIDPHFMHFILEKFDLNPVGYDIRLYFSAIAIAIDFLLEQYAYKIGGREIVYVEKGDIVLDIGGCWADTALYFAHKTGPSGMVYSFEFIPGNIKLHKINTALNPELKDHIRLVEHPVWDKTGEKIFFRDNGPGSKIEFTSFEDQTGSATTISIDDFVLANNIQKVDFIKMDIEGAEPTALKGAIKTIEKHRPKLAIATYHSMDDFVNIPNWILDLGLDYEIFIGHYTIHVEETICFAKPK